MSFARNIERKFALKPDMSMVHYDLTSSYFEGSKDNDLVLFGYSRDRKRGKEQIAIGLVMADGIPIHHEVWKGNTIDPETLEATIAVLKDRFRIKNVILIAAPVRLGSGTVMIRSESEMAGNLLSRMNIPYPEKIVDGARTGKT